ncbi:MAG: hypothetical protein J7497_09430 [Chitinophagaceae bacterium]|nr:hypothetical protein [Chitinophagaceae bacterium]
MKKLVSISILIPLVLPFYSLSQTRVEKGFELHEVMKIAEMYKNVPNLSFTVNYKYTDSIRVDSVLEQLTGYSKISDGRYYSFLDSSEFIQGYQYNILVFHRDSAVIVNNRQEYPDLMKLPILDSIFQSAYVDSMKIIATDDVPINTLYLYLSPSSPYANYVLVYDRNNYRIQFIHFYIRNAPVEDGVTSGTGAVTVTFSAYSTAAVDQEKFWEDKFIYKQAGEIHLKPAYAGYQLLDNTTIKTNLPN